MYSYIVLWHTKCFIFYVTITLCRNMDRQIPKQQIRREKIRRWTITGAIIVAIAVAVLAVSTLARTALKASDLTFAEVDRGTIETTVASTGRIVPAFEEVITSPISSRIKEVYLKAGDTVNIGTPILRLDLTTTQAELDKLIDQQGMKNLEREQLRLSATTTLTDLEMRIRVKEMEVSQLAVELANEIYLDSLGTGTGDRVKEATLKHRTSTLELEQLKRQLENSRNSAKATLEAKDLELSISRKNLSLQTQVLADAQIRATRRATLTVLHSGIGQPVAEGAHVATIADLDHFKVESQISDTQAEKIRPGARAIVKVGRTGIPGIVTNVTPQSTGGMITFSVALDNDNGPRLRSGLKADVHVMWDVIEDAVRIPVIPSYIGPGNYDIFVVSPDGSELVRRTVGLGGCNYDRIEVTSGLDPGERIVTGNMSKYVTSPSIKLK